MVDALHVQLVALYRWQPEHVWERIGLFDGIEYLREGLRHAALSAQLQGAVLLSPLMPAGARRDLQEFLESLEPAAEPVSLADKWGEDVAREVAELEERNRKLLKDKGYGRL